MKRFSGIFLLFVITALTSYSQFISHCTFYTEDNAKFTVYLDGEKKNEEPQTRVRILNLTEPHFKLKIVFADTSYEPIVRKAFALQDTKGYPVDVTYSITKSKKGFYKMHFMDQKIYPGYIKPINLQPKTVVVKDTVKVTSTGACAQSTLSKEEYSDAIASMTSIKMDESRFLLAKQIITDNCLMVDQIKGILENVDTEDKKLILAKEAYSRTVDKGNFFKLNVFFKEEKNIEALYQSILK